MYQSASDNMSTYHYPLTASRRFQSTETYQPFHSALHSKAFIGLQLSKPSQLITEHSHNTSISSLELSENPFTSYSSFSMYESRQAHPPLKENPFLTATPFRFYPKDIVKQTGKGLSAWEKQKYLDMYADSRPAEEISDHAEVSFQKYDTPPEGVERIIRRKETVKESVSKVPRLENLAQEYQPNTATFKKRNTLTFEQENHSGFRKMSAVDLKSKFSELENANKQVSNSWNYQKDDYNNILKEEYNQQKQENSLIHNLKGKQVKNIKMTNSRVLEYQYGSNQLNYPSEIQERPRMERQVETVIRSRNDDKFNFDDKEGSQDSARQEGTYVNKIKQPPAYITYKYEKYDLIKII